MIAAAIGDTGLSTRTSSKVDGLDRVGTRSSDKAETHEISKPYYSYAVDRGVAMRARDGTELVMDIYYPAIDDKRVEAAFPCLLERTPYNRSRQVLVLTGKFFARHGYVVVIQDVRGRFDSGGDWAFLFNPADEGKDGYDTVEWIAAQPWCDGQVGTFGLSYPAWCEQALAVERPPHLTTQFIMEAGFNLWHRTVRDGGAFCLSMFLDYVFYMAKDGKEAASDPVAKAQLQKAAGELEPLLKAMPLRKGATALALAPTYEQWYLDIATRADYDDFWHNPGCNLEPFIDSYPDVPIFDATGWYGQDSWACLEKFKRFMAQDRRNPYHLMIGPWIHDWNFFQVSWAGEVDFGAEAIVGHFNELRLAWFDRWMKGLQTGAAQDTAIELFVMGGGDGRKDQYGRMRHGGRWITVTEWPLRDTAWTDFYLHGDGSLSPEQPRHEGSLGYSYDPDDPVPTVGGTFQATTLPGVGLPQGGAFDQRCRKDYWTCSNELPLSARDDVLVFETEPLEESVEVIGPVVVTLWISSSAVDTDFTAKLIDVYPPSADYPQGFAMNLTDGIQRCRYRSSREKAEFMEPGAIYELCFEIPPVANRFAAGHRIRLDISSSNFPRYDANPNTGEPLGLNRGKQTAWNSVHFGTDRPSRIRLPLRPSSADPKS